MIESRAYARAGLLGNPSDGYFGKTISCIVRNFRARVLVYPSARLEIKASPADTPIFQSLAELRELTRWRGYYGGVRLIQALLVRLAQYCEAQGLELPDRNFTVEYESTIPQRLGLGGSSAIITAALRALLQFFGIEVPKPIQANLILETETRELGVPAGLQDRVIQVYEGLVYMDFDRRLMESRGYGEYEALDPGLLPPLYIAYRTALGEGTEVLHSDLRHRYQSGDAAVLEAIRRWAGIAEEGRAALLERDIPRLARLMNENFDLRARVCRVSEGNREMIEAARAAGVPSNFAGSGGAVVGCYPGEETYQRLEQAFRAIGVTVIKPVIAPLRSSPASEPATAG
jgi:glucuronokinase